MKHEPECRCKECEVQRVIEKVTKEWADQGQVIEGGWQAFRLTGIPEGAPQRQLAEMHKAYFLGAQHLFASIMTILEPGTEATENDMDRLTLISQELYRFTQSLRKNN